MPLDSMRREYWLDQASDAVWAVALSGQDDSVLACAGPFAPRVAAVVGVDQLALVAGPTLEWLRGRREHFRPFVANGGTAPARAPEPVAPDTSFHALLSEARRVTRAEAGTVFRRAAETMRFAASQNEVLERRLGVEQARRRLAGDPLPLDERSIASYVLLTHMPVNMRNAYDIPVDLPYVFNPQWDQRNDYVTRSVLTMPLRDARGSIIGVLQLINARGEDGAIVPFSDEVQDQVGLLLVQWAHRLSGV